MESPSSPERSKTIYQLAIENIVAEINYQVKWLKGANDELVFTVTAPAGTTLFNEKYALQQANDLIMKDRDVADKYISRAMESLYEVPPVIRLQEIII